MTETSLCHSNFEGQFHKGFHNRAQTLHVDHQHFNPILDLKLQLHLHKPVIEQERGRRDSDETHCGGREQLIRMCWIEMSDHRWKRQMLLQQLQRQFNNWKGLKIRCVCSKAVADDFQYLIFNVLFI